jgi:hypothetical protein
MMNDEMYNVNFHDVDGGYFTGMLVSRSQAAAILDLEEGKRLSLDSIRWIRLQQSSDPAVNVRVYHYHHGGRGGYGYLTAPEAELRNGLVAVLLQDDD